MHQAPAALRDQSRREDVHRASADRLEAEPAATHPGNPCDRAAVQKVQDVFVKRILVATDFSLASSKAVECAVALANQCNAFLTILHVIDVNTQAGSGTAEDLMKNLWAQGSAQMGQLAWSLSGRVEAQTILAEGLPWEVILEKSQDFGLLVLGQSGGRTARKLFSQHTLERVLGNSGCPVTVVPFKA
jgi:nucleotide-binding universal stress UspA family protein